MLFSVLHKLLGNRLTISKDFIVTINNILLFIYILYIYYNMLYTWREKSHLQSVLQLRLDAAFLSCLVFQLSWMGTKTNQRWIQLPVPLVLATVTVLSVLPHPRTMGVRLLDFISSCVSHLISRSLSLCVYKNSWRHTWGFLFGLVPDMA